MNAQVKALTQQQLIIEDLTVQFGERIVVENLSLHLSAGKCIALVGESGSGKSVTARSIVGLAGAGAKVQAKTFQYGEHNLLQLSERQWRKIRGKDIGFILQDALVSLDPLRPIGQEIYETLAAHGCGNRHQRQEGVLQLLQQVGIPEPELRVKQRSEQLSGGLRQRALIANALALNPSLIIADEPTTALDATVQARILDVLQEIKTRGSSLLLISHDLAVVAKLADEVLVLHHGNVLEQGPIQQILKNPQHAYTKSLLAALPAEHPRGYRLTSNQQNDRPQSHICVDDQPLLVAQSLAKRYLGPDKQWRQIIEQIDISLFAGRTLGIVGESGSGKSTVAKIVLGLLQPDAGQVTFSGEIWNGTGEWAVAEKKRRLRRHEISVIYQDPLSSFDPRWSVGQILEDALEVGQVPESERKKQVRELLHKVRLPAELSNRRPLQLSGGQRQRVAIARAIASKPKIIVCDEPVSALDVSVQAQVLDLLDELQEEMGVAYLFISHDLGVIRHVSDDVVVMSQGRIVEQGTTEQVFKNPQHPYTQQLLAAVPRLIAGEEKIESKHPWVVFQWAC
ncbi:ABC transporter ATP-binding protein [Acinetobacter qingfengensis]|uniref:ABC transporter ATP-binding protein n=1 Tax=Acinetobacter qingfengensis TaxID=1262585 RepID=A0A1E7R647_9GAMM|nr:ABC transporter ATP-binding protein [Acinetobacter qingfengensis]KAA8734871.1 ABC transporter ATP-binding protein [Acinetobacter qingfengensis]OEY94791.1 ABC transporter ATP-binding protein [Acinetobacter qingfengensis]